MAIFKKKNKPGNLSDTRYIGVLVPQALYLKLMLYTTATGTTKSMCIKNLLQNNFNANITGLSDSVMITQIIQKVRNNWKQRKIIDPTISLEQYKIEVALELKNKTFPEEIIQQIINDI